MAKTLFDKVWDSHVVRQVQDGPDVFFIDRHFIHEVTSPVAFLGLESRGNSVVLSRAYLRYCRSQYANYQSTFTRGRRIVCKPAKCIGS